MVTSAALTYAVHAYSAAPPERVFAVLADAPGWSRWAGPLVRWSDWERPGDPVGGVGAVRRLGTRLVHSREQIVEYDPPHRLAYTVLSAPMPTRDYRAQVVLTPDGAGTRIDWSGRFTAAVPGSGALVRLALLGVVRGFARRLAAAAEAG